eukprot:gnl/MRDRNA2_/MRDRNA2_113018_c0_seq1.p1 gnl/MRDRNA2_/MRDRNA2_113018_c0~~gnl/MRDRNA2_/MRDRNA2_113018_c0_seq1.p1  ORF type:complete len:258 (-),score=39.14 gnl/MRDRNA2_/MRDRNA2_113018_c0_seq1:198-971(-)
MADQLAVPLNQDVEPSRSRLSGKVIFLSVFISLSGVALWASIKVHHPVGAIDDATSLAVQPMKQVMQPARFFAPMQGAQSRNFMQPRAVFNEMQGATTDPDPSRRRAILAGLAVLPMVAMADQAKAALKVDDFVPYFNYEGDLSVKGKVNSEGLTAGQKLSWDFSGMDPKCEGGPGEKPNSCGVHIHKGESCKEDALGHYFASAEDPWKTITYTSKNGKASKSNVEVTTELTNADVKGRTFIVHNYEGARVACGILK